MVSQTVNRAELRYYASDWKAYAQRFGYLDLRKTLWKTLKTAGLARYLRANGIEVAKVRDGNPTLSLRLVGPLMEWVERNGGGEFVRAKLEQLALAELGACAYGWERVKTVRTFRLLGKTEDQREFVLWRRAQAFLFLPPDTEPERTTRGYRSEREARERLERQAGCEVRDVAAHLVAAPEVGDGFENRFFGAGGLPKALAKSTNGSGHYS